jgi:hypothetical protein
MPGTDELSLFSRRGMANNGWHRFRVPLRPSFNSIRLKVRINRDFTIFTDPSIFADPKRVCYTF